MLFVSNQFIAVSDFFRKISESSVKSLLPTYIVLSPAKFASSASLMKKNKSFIKRLKGTGPRIKGTGPSHSRCLQVYSFEFYVDRSPYIRVLQKQF